MKVGQTVPVRFPWGDVAGTVESLTPGGAVIRWAGGVEEITADQVVGPWPTTGRLVFEQLPPAGYLRSPVDAAQAVVAR